MRKKKLWGLEHLYEILEGREPLWQHFLPGCRGLSPKLSSDRMQAHYALSSLLFFSSLHVALQIICSFSCI